MPIIHEEIIEDIEAHIRKSHGACNDWWVGTAKDARAPFFRRHLATDLGDELIYREAFTTTAADAVIDHLVNQCGLRLDRDAVPEPGKIVFVYRRTRDSGFGVRDSGLGIRDSGERGAAQGTPQPAPAALRSDQATFPRRAA